MNVDTFHVLVKRLLITGFVIAGAFLGITWMADLKYRAFALMLFSTVTVLVIVWSWRGVEIIGWTLRRLTETGSHQVEWGDARRAPLGHALTGMAAAMAVTMLAFALTDAAAYRRLISEDGWVEWLSVGFWALALVAALVTLMGRFKTVAPHRLHAPLVLLSLFFFVCAGEEASWGQRVLAIETPALIGKVNVQNETNLHNLGSISLFSNAFFLISLTFFVLVPWLANKHPKLNGLLYGLGIDRPDMHVVRIFRIALVSWIVVGLIFGTLGFHPFSFYAEKYYNQMDDEYFEMMAAFSFAAYALRSAFCPPVLRRVG